MRVLVLALFPLACAPFTDQAALAAQALATRVAAVSDGEARMTFKARDGVCGDGQSLIVEYLDGRGETRVYSTGSMSIVSSFGDRITDRCEPGPVSVVLSVRSREVTSIRVRVGPVLAGSAERSLGNVAAAEAAAYLVGVAENASDKVAHDALLAASLADSARISARLATIARNKSARPTLRERALRFLPDAARREGEGNSKAIARAIAIDNDDVLSVRERAVRVFAQEAGTAELRDLFGRVQQTTLRERALRSAGEIGDKAAQDWMLAVMRDNAQPVGLRERAIRVLGDEMGRDDLLRAAFPTINEIALRERILRAQSEAGGGEARTFLRGVAEDRSAPRTLRERAIRSLGEQGDIEYLRQLYARLDDRGLRERALRVTSEAGDATDFLRAIALNEKEDASLRERAVRLLAEHGLPSSELAGLYDRMEERALRSRIIQLLAERGDDAAWSKLESISRGEADPDLRRRALRTLQRS